MLKKMVSEGLITKKDDERYELTKNGRIVKTNLFEHFQSPKNGDPLPISMENSLTAINWHVSYMEDTSKEQIAPYKESIESLIERLEKLQKSGIITFTAAFTSFQIALTFSQQSTVTPIYVDLLWLVSLIMVLGFVYAEKKAKKPVLLLYLFKNSVFTVSTVSVFLLGAITLAGTAYIPVFLQLVQGMGHQISGLFLTPLMFSMIVTAILFGQIISKTGTYKKLAIISFATGALGMFLLSTLNPTKQTLRS